ncbi:hypothetical protein DICPUDRAFT_147527 [Dictyostelium purpureum]|uniref:Mediator of DNA damage checkpoint protein 1 n=1 Tax=Dictyostelium purpureum TaxID=5786 RepID=F0Z8Q4_DICPU|nr:uncharacterized protein DICPUDRAFT_147527 [Dictyostelium purpureum]EGC39671.1 hypothetical protein DICPUDRAFT_147527 [Dictyostelium purpureum]|eukprot:XP_003283780.1 hypothetical protein DICPUDRAFT_147527 [Dictyostelium purpureum]
MTSESKICISPVLCLKKLNGVLIEFKVNPGKNRIGRASSNDIYLKDEPTVSNYHAQLEFSNSNKFLIRDLFSSNKTSIQFKENDELITLKPNIDYEITKNSKIVLGSATMILNYIEIETKENVNKNAPTPKPINNTNTTKLNPPTILPSNTSSTEILTNVAATNETPSPKINTETESPITLPSKPTTTKTTASATSLPTSPKLNSNSKPNNNVENNSVPIDNKRKEPESNSKANDEENMDIDNHNDPEKELKTKKLKVVDENKEMDKEIEKAQEEEEIPLSPSFKPEETVKIKDNDDNNNINNSNDKESSKDSQQSNSQVSNQSGESKKKSRKPKSLADDEFVSQIITSTPSKRKSVKPERLEEQIAMGESSSQTSSSPSTPSKSSTKKSQTTETKTSTTTAKRDINILFSMFSDEEAKELENIILKLGGNVAKNSEECTHLVANELKRSKKILECISYGKLIVTSKWLKDSKKSSKWLDESGYHLVDKKAEAEWSFNLEKSLELARRNHSDDTLIFKNLSFYITKNSIPPRDFLKELIEINGGSLDDNLSNSSSIILANPDKDKRSFKKWNDKGYKISKGDFILLSILSQKLIYINCE